MESAVAVAIENTLTTAKSSPDTLMTEDTSVETTQPIQNTSVTSIEHELVDVDGMKQHAEENSDSLNTPEGISTVKSEAQVLKKAKLEEQPAEKKKVTNTTPPVSNDTPPLSNDTPPVANTTPSVAIAAPVLKPSLRGSYELSENESGSWEGKWGMDDTAFTSGGITSPFAYTSTPLETELKNKAGVTNASFSGYFMLGSAVPGAPSTKHEESNIVCEFFDAPDGTDQMLKVVGHGKNAFGQFNLEGTYNLNTKELHCYRAYEPVKKRGRAGRKSRGTGSSTGSVKSSAGRSKRQRPTNAEKPKSADVVDPQLFGGRVARIRRTPSHLIDDDIEPVAKSSMGKMKALLEKLISNDKEGWFLQPVNAQALGLANYHKVVKKPMDLGTIKKKVESDSYEDFEGVAEDIRLVFNNACLFNPAGHPVNRVASQHLKMFEKEYKVVVRSSVQKAKPKKKTVDGGGRRKRPAQPQVKKNTSRQNPFGSSSEDDDEEDESEFVAAKASKRKKANRRKSKEGEPSEMKVLRKQVEMMNKQIEMMQQMQEQNLFMNNHLLSGQQQAQPISAPPAASQTKKREIRPLSYQEKRQLGQDIHKLESNDIQGVINIIQESGTALGGEGDEVELDIEALDPVAMKKLQKYVRRCLSKSRSKKSKEDIDSMIVG